MFFQRTVFQDKTAVMSEVTAASDDRVGYAAASICQRIESDCYIQIGDFSIPYFCGGEKGGEKICANIHLFPVERWGDS